MQGLEREIVPVEDRIAKLQQKASEVIHSSPQDTRQVQSRLVEVSSSWEALKTKSKDRNTQLDNAQLIHTFMADSRDMVRIRYYCVDYTLCTHVIVTLHN